LGGTFDPIHYGHLVAAEEVRFRLSLARVLFVPVGVAPHKRRQTISPAEHRVAMVELAIASNPYFSLSRLEVDRPGPSYSVDTVRLLREQLGREVELYFIVGSDALSDLLTWREPARLVQLCQLVAIARPGWPVEIAPVEAQLPEAAGRIVQVPIPQLDISSSDLRRRVAEGQPIRYQVPEAVEGYIMSRGLYRGAPL